jgi:hypothetical protein
MKKEKTFSWTVGLHAIDTYFYECAEYMRCGLGYPLWARKELPRFLSSISPLKLPVSAQLSASQHSSNRVAHAQCVCSAFGFNESKYELHTFASTSWLCESKYGFEFFQHLGLEFFFFFCRPSPHWVIKTAEFVLIADDDANQALGSSTVNEFVALATDEVETRIKVIVESVAFGTCHLFDIHSTFAFTLECF